MADRVPSVSCTSPDTSPQRRYLSLRDNNGGPPRDKAAYDVGNEPEVIRPLFAYGAKEEATATFASPRNEPGSPFNGSHAESSLFRFIFRVSSDTSESPMNTSARSRVTPGSMLRATRT
ncbi:hypothetical protein KM043_012638 [Ampulex compressa]|nr:hypothetical protein KM043_012638 [Ampulex compressa]